MKEKLSKKDVGFAQIKNEILSSTFLTWKAKGIYAYLYSKPDDWDFSADRICLEGIGDRKTILNGLKELEEFGVLERKRLGDGRVEYHITYEPTVPKTDCGDEEPKSGNATVAFGHGGKNGLISNKDLITNKEFITNKESFEIFWNLYDKKVGKPKAEKKWNKLSPEEQKAILEYIPKYKIAQPDKTYRKNPETFLNNRGWEDELIADNKGENKGAWQCEYGYMHKRGEECGHALERRYQTSEYAGQLSDKFKIKR